MTIITKHYFLPEDSNEFKIDNISEKLASIIWEFGINRFKNHLKYNNADLTEAELSGIEVIRNEFFEMLENEGINIDDLG